MAGLNKALGALVAGSLMFSSTGVVAGTPPPVPIKQINPWAALAVLSNGASAAALCGGAAATAAAAQAGTGCVLPVVDAAPPPPPPVAAPVQPIAAASPGVGLNPLALGLLALVAGIGLYLAVRGGGSNNNGNTPT